MAKGLNSRTQEIEEIFDAVDGFLEELFKHEEFSEFSLRNSQEWEVDWSASMGERLIQIQNNTEKDEHKSEVNFSLYIELNKLITTSYSEYNERDNHRWTETEDKFTVEGLSVEAAAGKIIARIAGQYPRFSQCLELFRTNNPEIISPPTTSPYAKNASVQTLFP